MMSSSVCIRPSLVKFVCIRAHDDLVKVVRGRIIRAMTKSAHSHQPNHPAQQPHRSEREFQHPALRQTDSIHRFMEQMGVRVSLGAELMRLVRLTAHTFDGVMAASIRQGRLSPPRLRLLMCLFVHEAKGGTSLSPTELSRHLSLSKNTISAHLRALEEAGLLQRDVDPDDLRQFQIRLAESGRNLIVESAPQHMEHMDHLVQELSRDEIEQLQGLLAKLLDSIYMHGLNGEHVCEPKNSKARKAETDAD